MLTFRLGKHLVHALAFSPDGTRLAVACGRKVTCLDWQSPGEPVWHEPTAYTQGCPVWLSFRPSCDGIFAGYGDVRHHHACWRVLDIDLTGGSNVEALPLTGPNVSWALHSPIVVAGATPTAFLAASHQTTDSTWLSFVVTTGGRAMAYLTGLPATNPARPASPFVSPRAAWVVRQNRLLVWSEGYFRWFSWPPPALPAPSASFWGTLSAALTGVRRVVTMPVNDLPNRGALAWAFAGVRPLPPELPAIAEHEFPFLADAVAPLPDGDTLLVAHKGTLVRWHAPTGTELARWRWPKMQAPRSLAVSPDGTVAAVGGNGGRVVIWDLDV